MPEKIATVIGATGLIGSHLVDLLQNDDYYTGIRIITRRSINPQSSKVETRVINFGDEQAFRSAISGSSAVFCAVGTTRKKVRGDLAEYRKVDYDIPVNAARFCALTGCGSFLLVSSVGADKESGNFYLKMKGEAETAVRNTGVNSVSVFRPSMLMGSRKEFRAGELIGRAVVIPLKFLFPARYKPIEGRNVARAMISASKRNIGGFNVYHYNDIMRLIS